MSKINLFNTFAYAIKGPVLWGVLLLGLILCPLQNSLGETSSSSKLPSTGLVMPTAEQTALYNKTHARVKSIKNLNALGLYRVNLDRAKKGLPLLPQSTAVAFGTEMELVNDYALNNHQKIEGTDPLTLSATAASAVDNSALASFPPIGNQGDTGTCQSWATTYYQLTSMNALAQSFNLNGKGWTVSNNGVGDPTKIFSPEWTYNLINNGQDLGAYAYQPYGIIENNGAAPLSAVPFLENFTPWDLNSNDWQNALSVRATSAPLMADSDSAADITSWIGLMKQALTNGYVVTMPTYAWSWVYPSTTIDPQQENIVTENGTDGAHLPTIVGYDDNHVIQYTSSISLTGAFKMANSWGTSYGDQGYYWIAYDALYPKTQTSHTALNVSGRQPVIDGYVVYTLLPNQNPPKVMAKFTLSNVNYRNAIGVTLGVSATSASTPNESKTLTFPWGAFNTYAGDLSFNGTTTPVDGTFYLDFSSILPQANTAQNYYLGITPTNQCYGSIEPTSITCSDYTSATCPINIGCEVKSSKCAGGTVSVLCSSQPQSSCLSDYKCTWEVANPVTIKSFQLIDQTHQTAEPVIASNLPVTAPNGKTTYATINNYTYNGHVQPTAKITLSPSGEAISGSDTLTVGFDGSSSTAVSPSTITSYSWDFGDGSTGSGSATVSHTYTNLTQSNEFYNVVLTVTDSLGGVASYTYPVAVNLTPLPSPPTASATETIDSTGKAGNSGTAPLTIDFNASASTKCSTCTITSYVWNFGDGNTATTNTPTVSNTYRVVATSAVHFTPTLTITDSRGATATASLVQITTNAVSVPPIASATTTPATPISGTAPLSVSFDGSASSTATGDTITNYIWNFGDGNTLTTTSPTTSYIYQTAGTFKSTLQIEDSRGMESQVKAVSTATVAANPNNNPVAPTFTTTPINTTVTSGSTATFYAAATGTPTPTYQWQLSTNNGASFTPISGATSAIYTTSATSSSMSGYEYDVVASNGTLPNATSTAATLTVTAATSAPAITTQPASTTVAVGATATFTAAASGNPTPTYQWQLSTNSGTTFNAISGATSASYTTGNTTSTMSGYEYRVVASNTIAGTTSNATSNAATLTVNTATGAPVITTQPTNQTAITNGVATFTVTATGTPAPTYQWQVSTNGGSSWTSISGATSASYSTPAAPVSMNGYEYNVIVKNSVGSVTSNAATLLVEGVINLPNVSVIANGTATFTVVTTDTQPNPLSYLWEICSPGGGCTYNPISTSSSYTIGFPVPITMNGTTVSVAVYYNYGAANQYIAFSNTATLTVTASTEAPVFTAQPASTTIAVGSTASFTAAASGTPTPTYQWQMSTNSGSTWTSINGATSATYTTATTTASMNGYEYEVVASNGTLPNATSNPATLTVISLPTVTTEPISTTVTAPASATFSIVVTGPIIPTYEWEMSTTGPTGFRPISGATSAIYTTGATTTSMNGTLYLVNLNFTSNGVAWSLTSPYVTLTVNASTSAPVITSQPASTTVVVGSTATFTAAASGSPTPSYQWQISTNGGTSWTSISGASSSSYTTGTTTSTMNGYEYEVVASNGTLPNATSSAATLTVTGGNSAPVFTSQPVSVSVATGATATFTAAATGTPAPTYQWEFSTNGGASFAPILGSTGTTYTTGPTTASMNGYEYEVVAINGVLPDAVSTPATLTVNSTSSAPVITTQPASVTTNAGTTATFTAAATGTPTPTYQWELSTNSGVNFAPISGATSASYTTASTTASMNGYEYEVVASNGTLPNATSSAAILTVASGPVITTQPASVSVTAGSPATFSVVVAGNPATDMFQWFISTDGGSTFTQVAGATSPSYTINSTTTSMNGYMYNVWIKNSVSQLFSSNATLTVNAATSAPVITTQPASVSVVAPAAVTFTAAATGTPTPTYQWELSTNGGASFAPITGATSASYTINTTATTMSGYEYELVASNGTLPNATSSAATLTVSSTSGAPVISSQPVSTTAMVGQTATFTASATGNPQPIYQWMVSSNGGYFEPISGATSASYTTLAVTASMNGNQYEVIASNGVNPYATSNPATLTVVPAATTPVFTTQPAGVSVIAPAAVTFTAVATGTPTPTYQWELSTNGGVSFAPISGATSASYTIAATSPTMNGYEYEVIASNGAVSSTTSNIAMLTINPATTAPVITQQPASQSVVAPASATFIAAATGNPTPGYQWQISTNNGTTWSAISGATSASYTIGSTTTSMNGAEYEVVASNGTLPNATSAVATLTVTAPTSAPVITTQPSSVSVTAGATASFNVVATGTPTPTYQWELSTNGGVSFAPISGATNASYTTAVTTTTMNGYAYKVVASNGTLPNATSAVATLTVNAASSAPVITTQPSSVSVTAGATASFNVVATGTPTPTYQWELSTNGGVSFAPISGATNASYTTAVTTTTMNGYAYKVVASNGTLPNATSAVATLTVTAPTSAPVITTQPSSVSVTAGATASFNVVATGTPTPTYQWELSTNGGVSFAPISGATNASYTTAVTTTAMNGYEYEVVASNGTLPNATSAVATLTVNPASSSAPVISIQPVSQTVPRGSSVMFTAAATGNPTPTYQWQMSTDGINYAPIPGATNSILYMPAVIQNMSGEQFELVASNGISPNAVSNPATLTVSSFSRRLTIKASVVGDNGKISPSGTVNVRYGYNQNFVISPADGYIISQMLIDGNVTQPPQLYSSAVNASFHAASATYQFKNVTESHTISVQFSPAVTAPTLSATSTATTITLNWTAATGGVAPYKYKVLRWDYGTAPMPLPTIFPLTSDLTLTDTGLSPETTHNYAVIAIDSYGNSSSTNYGMPQLAVTTANAPDAAPVITSQPVNTTVPAPISWNIASNWAGFTVTATGVPYPTFQWQQSTDGGYTWTPVTGATYASFVTNQTYPSNSGTEYECVVSNSSGSVTSNPAILTVTGTLPPLGGTSTAGNSGLKVHT